MEKLIKKYFTKEVLLKTFMFFLIIQPIIDIHILFNESVVNFFGFSPATIIRVMFVGILTLLTLFTIKFSKLHISLILYIGLIFIYALFHHISALNFTSRVPGNFNYSLISEMFYIIRMLLPLSVIWISYNIKINNKNLSKIISWLIILISGSIVITNFLGISLGSYTSERIDANFFQWFMGAYDEYSFYGVASKGFFTFANQISALLLLLTPILIYLFIKKSSTKWIILLVLQLLAMLMLGTKVAGYGFICVTIISVIVYWYFCFIKKEIQFSWYSNNVLLLLIMVFFVIIPFSPAKNRELIDDNRIDEYQSDKTGRLSEEKEELLSIDSMLLDISDEAKQRLHFIDEKLEASNDTMLEITDQRTLILPKEESDKILIPFIKENYENYAIRSRFIEQSYPYKYDPYFWYTIMKQPLGKRTDYRYIQTRMIERVIKINNNSNVKWFGISYVRMQNIFPLERDFQSHYYTLGILGLTLLVMPYVFLTIICGVAILINYKKNFTIKNILFLLGIGITLSASFYSGNVMDGLVVTLILGFVFGQLLQNIFCKKGI